MSGKRTKAKHSGAESEDDARPKMKLDGIDVADLEWQRNKRDFKCDKAKHKFKFEDLKAFRGYLVRVRAKNASGWGPWAEMLSVVTREC